MRVKHISYTGDLTLLANTPGALHTMLNRLAVCARFEHLTINITKSEIVRLNAKHGAEVPNFNVAGDTFQCSEYAQNLSSEHAARPMLVAANRASGFVRDTAFCNRPFASLLLAKAYIVPFEL